MDLTELSLGHQRFHRPAASSASLFVLAAKARRRRKQDRKVGGGQMVGDEGGGGGPPSKSFQFVMFTSVHAKKVMVTEGNTTTPGIHGPQHEEDSE